VFLLVLAYLGSPRPRAVKQLCVCVCACACASQVYELDGTVHDSRWFWGTQVNIIQQFVRDHPDFTGAKVIYSLRRSLNIMFMNFTVCQQFLLHDTMLPRYMLWTCVCLLSLTVRSSTKPAKHWGIQTMLHEKITNGFWFSDVKDFREIPPGSPPAGVPNESGIG